MIEPSVKEEILRRLKAAEEGNGVRILMAIESGSRAWGFASPNSDYDVRFIYLRDTDWYLSIDLEDKRDVIEYPIVDEIDLNGWDIRKALKLFLKSNPAFVEWLQSPITYMEQGSFRRNATELLPKIYSAEKGIYHYRSMAKTNYRGYLRESSVPLKKYFYVLRPLLAIRWLEKYGKAAPIQFHKLLELVEDQSLLDAIYNLLEKKKVSEEKMMAPPIPELNKFIEDELNRLEDMQPSKSSSTIKVSELNQLFRASLGSGVSAQQSS